MVLLKYLTFLQGIYYMSYNQCLYTYDSKIYLFPFTVPVISQEMGGYFIVNGIEKVIRMLIMPRRNYPIAMSRPKWKNRGQGYTQYGKF